METKMVAENDAIIIRAKIRIMTVIKLILKTSPWQISTSKTTARYCIKSQIVTMWCNTARETLSLLPL
jgi:lysophospholipid acyltransferase (LPLAT)-like uncharacterized protein